MPTPDDVKAKAAAAYNAAADFYDDAANSFWERFGCRTIERLHLQHGARILDVCCGSGASAIPAAEKVGPEGFVLGIDLAEKLLELARMKASDRGLQNIEFRAGDMLDLRLPESEFDAVVCVFGIFFVPGCTKASTHGTASVILHRSASCYPTQALMKQKWSLRPVRTQSRRPKPGGQQSLGQAIEARWSNSTRRLANLSAPST